MRTFGLMVCTLVVGSAVEAQTSSPPSSRAGNAASGALVLDQVTVIDVERGERRPGQRVVLAGNRIQAVGRADAVALPKGAQVVDARGKYLIPGLWDMHVHARTSAPDIVYPLLVASGVTGIRDASSEVPLDTLTRWRREILAGTRVGPPRQLLSGQALDQVPACTPERTSPHACAPDLPDEAPASADSLQALQAMLQQVQQAMSGQSGADLDTVRRNARIAMCVRANLGSSHHTCVSDSADARHVVDSLRAAGADMIKTYDLSRAMYFVVAAEARRLGVPFGGHLNWATAVEASDSGARLLDHSFASGDLAARCIPKPEPHAVTERTPDGGMVMRLQNTPIFNSNSMRFVADPTIERCRPVAERFIRNGTWWVPTFLVESAFLGPYAKAVADRLKAYTDEFHRGSVLNPYSRAHTGGAPPYDTHAAAAPDSLALWRIARAVGLPVVAGTDAQIDPSAGIDLLAGFSLHAELASYVVEGMTPAEALRTATLNPAKMLRGTDSLGTVTPGKLADLVLLDADPLADITNTTQIRAVVTDGRYFDRAALDGLLAEAQAKLKQIP